MSPFRKAGARLRYSLDVITLVIKKYGFSGLYTLVKDDILFDFRHGVDTYASLSKEELFTGDRLVLQNRYFPSPFGLIDLAIEEARTILGEDIRKCHFLDYGSGKGKVLIGAVRNGFEMARGIEYTERLHRVAESNLQKLGLCDRAKSIHGDATEFFPSPKDRVIYFFNPFEGFVLDQTLKNIKSVVPDRRILVIASTDARVSAGTGID